MSWHTWNVYLPESTSGIGIASSTKLTSSHFSKKTMQGLYVEQNFRTDVSSTRYILYCVVENMQYQPLQRLVSYQHAILHPKLHETGYLIPTDLEIVRLLTFVVWIHCRMHRQQFHVHMKLCGPLYVTYTFASLDDEGLDELSNGRHHLALQRYNFGSACAVII